MDPFFVFCCHKTNKNFDEIWHWWPVLSINLYLSRVTAALSESQWVIKNLVGITCVSKIPGFQRNINQTSDSYSVPYFDWNFLYRHGTKSFSLRSYLLFQQSIPIKPEAVDSPYYARTRTHTHSHTHTHTHTHTVSLLRVIPKTNNYFHAPRLSVVFIIDTDCVHRERNFSTTLLSVNFQCVV